jgi:hypothetical protein
VLAEVGQVRLDEFRGRLRKDDLPSMTRRRDTGGEMHLLPDIALVAHTRLARVHADAHLDRSRGEGGRHRRRGRERPVSRGEGKEEGVSLSVDLDACVL